MKIFIFGAGASKGSQLTQVNDLQKSPVTDELFDIRYKQYALEINLSDTDLNEYRKELNQLRINAKTETNSSLFEFWLTNKWKSWSSLPPNYNRRQSGKFAELVLFLWTLFINISKSYDTSNAYGKLLEKLQSIDCGFINFNYDTLLDKAMHDEFSVTFDSLKPYIQENYIKPHGSINWFCGNRSSDPSRDSGDNRIKLQYSRNYMFNGGPLDTEKIYAINPQDNQRLEHSFFNDYPLIFLPVTEKQFDWVRGFKEKIVDNGKNLLRQAEEIFLIGYRAHDDLIHLMLKHAPENTPLHIVGNEKDNVVEIMDRVLKKSSNLKEGKQYFSTNSPKNGFKEFIEIYNPEVNQ